jgi:hypothetical protein
MDDWYRSVATGAIGGIVAGVVILWLIQGSLPWFYRKVLARPLSLLMHCRRCDCGHWSGAYAYDPQTEQTNCPPCYRTRTGAGTAAP